MRESHIVISGATGGIGRAIAKRLAERGHRLSLLGRDMCSLETLSSELPRAARHRVFAIDLRDAEAIEVLCHQLSELGVDGLVNNAGVSQFALLSDSYDAEDLMAVNLLAPIRLTQSLLPALRDSPRPCVINIGSSFGSIGYPGFSLYCASKFGLRGFTEALQRELADQRIAIHYLAPRAVATEMNNAAVVAMNRELGNTMDHPEVVADTVETLLEKRRSCSHYLGWPERLFVGLNQILPFLVAKALRKQLPTIRRYAQRSEVTS